MRSPACFEDRDARALVKELCSKHDLDVQLLIDLAEVIQKHSGSGRKDGIVSEITICIDTFLHRNDRN